MEENKKIIMEYDIPEVVPPEKCESLYEGRSAVRKISESINPFNTEVTVLIQAYNRIEKTKQCIENVLKYTSEVDYDLLLIDNGSTDETFEFFKSIPYDKVRIIRLNRNITPTFTWNFIDLRCISKFLVVLANDIIVTPCWLKNLVIAAKSDERIGLVNPMSSNVSNYQGYEFEFSDLDDMQKKSALLNVSDSSQWHERLRVITLGSLIRKECLYAIGLPVSDMGFFHDFGDDDIAFQIRRAGYKVILARDTWIHHNHDVFKLEGKDPDKFKNSLETGRKNFCDKYYGIDAWDDVNNFVPEVLEKIVPPIDNSNCAILGIDVKCGTPVLEIKNHLRNYDIYNPECCAVTSEGKYFIDLQTVCGAENVIACAPDNAYSNFLNDSFDYVIIGNSINEYPEPLKIVKQIYHLLKKNGQMFVYLKNTFNVYSFLNVIGYHNVAPSTVSYNMTPEIFINQLKNIDITARVVDLLLDENIPSEYIDEINKKIDAFEKNDWEITKNRLLCDKYLLLIKK